MAALTAARSWYQAVSETVQKRTFVGENDILLDPNQTPLYVMTTKVGNRKKSTPTPRVEWIEDDYLSVWGQVDNASDHASNVTTILVVDGTLFATGDIVAVPKADSSASAEEVIRVTAISTHTLTVSRNIGGAGADTIGSSADLRILGSANAEYAAVGVPRTTQKSPKISYTQIFRKPISISGTMRASAQYGPANERRFQQRKALMEMRREIESAGLFSRASESLALPGSVRTTMGLKSRITTNVTNGNTTLTEAGALAFAQAAFDDTDGNEKILISAPDVISAFDYFGDGKLRLSTKEKVLGVSIQRFVTSHGDFLIVRDRLLSDGPNDPAFGDEAYAIDPRSIALYPLAGNGYSRNTSLTEDIVKSGIDGVTDEWLAEMAWVIRHQARHARLYNVSAYA